MKGSNHNIKFSYRYRDASNYKLFGEIIFPNPDNLPLTKINEAIIKALVSEEFFDPLLWKVPVLCLPLRNEDDHGWHELEEIEETTENATDERTISMFLEVAANNRPYLVGEGE